MPGAIGSPVRVNSKFNWMSETFHMVHMYVSIQGPGTQTNQTINVSCLMCVCKIQVFVDFQAEERLYSPYSGGQNTCKRSTTNESTACKDQWNCLHGITIYYCIIYIYILCMM